MNTNVAVVDHTLASLALATAMAQVGQCEVPKGSNNGPMVKLYLASVGLQPGNPWCQAFVHWCYSQAARDVLVQNPVAHTGHVLTAWQAIAIGRRIPAHDARMNKQLVKPGAQFFLDYGGGKGHTGIVEKVEGGVIHTIEGNSNDDGDREGYEVCRRQRPLSSKLLKGFVNYL